ncbi:MAG: hypothetical protein Ct9H300mP10_05530 [Methanobacteriota archaeon]|nr:MAG: hypothetical protein Ct9H300mP10_05530 [Euryarchaeota archaeon]
MGYAVSAATPFLLLAYVGPMIRERLPSGVTLADYVRIRLGRPMQVYVGIISVLYKVHLPVRRVHCDWQGDGNAIHNGAADSDGNGGNRHRGLHLQRGTSRFPSYRSGQAWTILFLVVALLLVLFGGDIDGLIADAKAYNPEDSWSIGSMSSMDSFESGLALIVAITAAEMFSQGNWQRAWASESDEALTKGAWLAAGMVLPLVLVMGVLGTVVAGQGAVEDPSAAFFYLIEDAGTLFVAAFIVLAVALVCSSVDTLQNAVVASVSRDLSDGSLGLKNARYLTIGLIPIAIYLATGPTIAGFTLDALSVFKIFLFADLLAAATVMPVLLTLWDRVSAKGALMGAICGLLSVIAYGTITEDIGTGIGYVFSPTNEFGLANLDVFLSAVIGSALVTVAGSYALPDESA